MGRQDSHEDAHPAVPGDPPTGPRVGPVTAGPAAVPPTAAPGPAAPGPTAAPEAPGASIGPGPSPVPTGAGAPGVSVPADSPGAIGRGQPAVARVTAVTRALTRGRIRWFALAAAILVLAATGTAVAVLVPSGRPAAVPVPSRSASPSPPPPPVLAAAGTGAPVPTPAAVAAALAGPVADQALGRDSVRVVDAVTGQVLYRHADTAPMIPASTMKLATSTALLALRGPAYQIKTRAVAGPEPGDVVLVGGGDPTLAVDDHGSYPGAARLDDLAGQVKRALGDTPPTRVLVDSSLFPGPTTGPHWLPEDYDAGGQVSRITALMHDGGRIDPTRIDTPSPRYASPDIATGQAFAKLLGVSAPVITGVAPAGARQLGVVASPPLISIIEQMLAESDNTVAEAMARQVAIAAGQPASFAGAATAVRQVLTGLGLPLDGVTIADGSGMSTDNRLTAQLLTGILVLAARPDHPKLHALFTGLPVAGYSGTLAERFRGSAGAAAHGVVRAKTGTLTGVNALAGYVTDADGRLLAFAVLANDTPGTWAAEASLDRIGTALATLG